MVTSASSTSAHRPAAPRLPRPTTWRSKAMRHRKAGRALRRTSEQKLALMRNLASSLIEHGAIETTEAKAKELRPFVEKLITKARAAPHHDRRQAVRHIHKRETADKLFQEVGPKNAKRAGGYTRILKTGHRKGDGAEMARIELVGVAGVED